MLYYILLLFKHIYINKNAFFCYHGDIELFRQIFALTLCPHPYLFLITYGKNNVDLAMNAMLCVDNIVTKNITVLV